MKDRHILEILDEKSFAEFGGDELKNFQIHCAECPDCRQAFEAARISSVLLNVRAAIPAPAPSAFFQSKVLNAIREKQNLRKPLAAFWRWWQASSALVWLMFFIVATLGILTFLAPKSNNEEAVSSTYNLYTTDAVILDQKPPHNLTNEQVLEVIYTERRDSVKK